MEANEMEAGTRDQGSQALQEFQGRHDDMRGAVSVRGFELQDDVAFWCVGQAFIRLRTGQQGAQKGRQQGPRE